jgi:hypothetical protein
MAAAPKKNAPTAAQAAAAEAVGEVDLSKPDATPDPAAPIVVPFRGAEFKIERDTLVSARYLIAVASNQPHTILFEALGQQQSAQFIRLCKPGEGLYDVAGEFFEALSKAAGWGNS